LFKITNSIKTKISYIVMMCWVSPDSPALRTFKGAALQVNDKSA